MIATEVSRPKAAVRHGLAFLAVLAASLAAVLAVAMIQQFALGVALFLAVAALTIRRPQFGLFTALFLLLLLEPQTNDPIMYYGWMIQSDVSSWTPLRFVNFTPIELILLVTAVVVLTGCVVERKALPAAQLRIPLLIFLGLIAMSLGYGLVTGGSLNKALWETRGLFAGGLIALLIPALLPRQEDVDRLINWLVVAAVLLSVEIIWRRFVVLASVPDTALDLQFAHDTPTFVNFVVVYLLARLIFPASKRQRLVALVIPLILYAEMLTNRRAGWIGLDLGIILLALMVFRLRRKVFFFIVLPLMLLYGGYLLIAWNADGAWAQPARAVRSINSPDARDAASNLYRYLEVADLRLNIHAHPVTGLGFGKPYTFYIPLPNLSWWPFWYYEAHNSVLWLWMEMGPLGFMAMLGLVAAGIVRGIQVLKRASRSQSAPALLALVSLLLMVLVFCYVDLGFVSTRIDALLGMALGIIGMWGRNLRALDDRAGMARVPEGRM